MNREKFYAQLRKRGSGVFGTSLSKRQVEATERLLDEARDLTLSHAAHVLAEVYHETGRGMWPVKETVYRNSKNKNPSDAEVIRRLDRAYAKGKLPWVKKTYWRDGAFGRGGIQITHWRNYEKLTKHVGVDLRKNPDLALDPVISARIAVKGCSLGLFTGKRLSDFDGPKFNHYNARSIVNGDRNKPVDGKKMGDKIAAYARSFEMALKAGGWGDTPRPDMEQIPEPESVNPVKHKRGLLSRIFGWGK